jgi:hypothetical protein
MMQPNLENQHRILIIGQGSFQKEYYRICKWVHGGNNYLTKRLRKPQLNEIQHGNNICCKFQSYALQFKWASELSIYDTLHHITKEM